MNDKKVLNGKRNRQSGHKWERDVAKVFRDLGYTHVVTTRSESRSRDAQKIDLINKDEATNGRLPFNIQAKCSNTHVKYAKLLSEMPTNEGVMNIVLHRQTEKKDIRFFTKRHYAIMFMEDFLELIKLKKIADEQKPIR